MACQPGGRAVAGLAPATALSPAQALATATSSTVAFTTIAYNAGNSARAWLARYGGVGGYGFASALAVGPAGQVFVTGDVGAHDGCCNFGTVAYQP